MRLIRHLAIAALVALFVMVLPAAAQAAAGDECKKGGHENLSSEPGGDAFKNQGQCVSHVASGGTTFPTGGGGADGAPVITGFVPPVIGPGCTVVITGTGFLGVTSVLFGGVPAQSFVIDSTNQITAVAPDPVLPGAIMLVEAPHLPAISEPYEATDSPCGEPLPS